MTTQSFSIRYCGPGFDDNSIDVRELAPSLLAIGDLFNEANKIIYGKESESSVRCRATVPGSFDVNLDLVLSAKEAMFAFITGAPAKTAYELVRVTFEAIKAIKWLRGQLPDGTKQLGNGAVEITAKHGSVTLSKDAATLAGNVELRRHIRFALGPLSKETCETITLQAKGDPEPIIVEGVDLPAFDLPPVTERQVSETERVVALSIVSPNFKDGNKWKFSDGGSEIWAAILDDAFIAKVQSAELKFGRGDALRCRVKQTQFQGSTGALRMDTEILEVIEILSAWRQSELF